MKTKGFKINQLRDEFLEGIAGGEDTFVVQNSAVREGIIISDGAFNALNNASIVAQSNPNFPLEAVAA